VPCPGKEVFEKLVGAFIFSMDAVIPRYQSRGGHPVLLGGDLLSRLAEVPIPSPLARLDLQIQALPVKRTCSGRGHPERLKGPKPRSPIGIDSIEEAVSKNGSGPGDPGKGFRKKKILEVYWEIAKKQAMIFFILPVPDT
jgi:hypothetical protein